MSGRHQAAIDSTAMAAADAPKTLSFRGKDLFPPI
jgi:hypothetical protein